MNNSKAREHYLSLRRQRDWTRYGPIIRQIATMEWSARRHRGIPQPFTRQSEATKIIRSQFAREVVQGP